MKASTKLQRIETLLTCAIQKEEYVDILFGEIIPKV
jgi:hypothetical protein